MDEPINLVLFSGTDDKLQAAAVMTAGAGGRGSGMRSLVCRLGPFGKFAKAGETAHQDPAHEAARGDHVRIGQAIPDLSSVAFRLHDPGRPHDREVLGDVRLADPHLVCEAADFLRLVGEEMEDLEPAGACEDLHDLRLEGPDRVHGRIIHPCASAHKVPMARSRDRPAGPPPAGRQGVPCRGGLDALPAGGGPQQIRGSCSPTSMSTIRSDPTIVWIVTMAG
jgi:hypothetical protein